MNVSKASEKWSEHGESPVPTNMSDNDEATQDKAAPRKPPASRNRPMPRVATVDKEANRSEKYKSKESSGQQKSIKSSSKNRVGAASAKVGEKKNGKQNSKKVKDQLRLEKKDGKKNKVRFQETVTDQDPHELDAEKIHEHPNSFGAVFEEMKIGIPGSLEVEIREEALSIVQDVAQAYKKLLGKRYHLTIEAIDYVSSWQHMKS